MPFKFLLIGKHRLARYAVDHNGRELSIMRENQLTHNMFNTKLKPQQNMYIPLHNFCKNIDKAQTPLFDMNNATKSNPAQSTAFVPQFI